MKGEALSNHSLHGKTAASVKTYLTDIRVNETLNEFIIPILA